MEAAEHGGRGRADGSARGQSVRHALEASERRLWLARLTRLLVAMAGVVMLAGIVLSNLPVPAQRAAPSAARTATPHGDVARAARDRPAPRAAVQRVASTTVATARPSSITASA